MSDLISIKEIDNRVKKLAKNNWKVKKIIEDCFDNKIEEIINKWPKGSKKSLMSMIDIEENNSNYYKLKEKNNA